ncbi:WhiB family transcriptional regulator [Streptomyces sp. NPDC051567]|uniref:WhiB family transcriptional regulator n=1 Tax=Streptomyces sp. NPDC051567 TaxID=3365660 RepID=UPI00379D09E4
MNRMTSLQARHTRRAVLQAAIDSGARCTPADADLFFRADGEHQADWQLRRADAVRLCAGCPVRAACAELALRDGDGNQLVDELVRGGLAGTELATLREDQAVRLAAAVAADRDTEGRLLDTLAGELRTEARRSPDPRVPARGAAQHQRIRTLADQIHEIRTARRARAGWGVAA